MANELTWVEMRSHVVEDYSSVANLYKNIIFDLKQFLTGAVGYPTNGTAGVWTVVSSSSGAGSYGNSDLWVSPANVIRATSGNHSWCRLSNATLGLECVIDVIGNADSAPFFLFFAPSFTGGNATSRPTGVYEWGHNTLTDGYGTKFNIDNNTATPMKVHGLLSTRGDWWYMTSHDGSNTLYAAMGVCRLSDTKTNDLSPWASFSYGNGYGLARNGFAPSGGGNGGQMNSNAGDLPGVCCRSYNRASIPNTFMYNMCCGVWPTAGYHSDFPLYGPLSSYEVDPADGLSLTFPVVVAITNAGYHTFKGRWPDVLFGAQSLANNTAAPSQAEQTKLKLGTCWLPFTGLVSL